MSAGNEGRSEAKNLPLLLAVNDAIVTAIFDGAVKADVSERLLAKRAGINRSSLRRLRKVENNVLRKQPISVIEMTSLCAALGLDPVAVYTQALESNLCPKP